MEAVYGWVKNIIYYMIFLSVVNNLLADSRYSKYIRFFAGVVLILLVVSPFTGSLKLDEQISSMFRSISFQSDTEDLKKELWGMEERRLEQVMGRYEAAVEEDVTAIARSEGLKCMGARVFIDSDRDSSRYGQIQQIQLVLGDAEGNTQHAEGNYPGSRPVNVEAGRIDGVRVEAIELGDGQAGLDSAGEENGIGREDSAGEPDSSDEPDSAQVMSNSAQGRINHLTGKVALYYGLEEADIKIQWKDD